MKNILIILLVLAGFTTIANLNLFSISNQTNYCADDVKAGMEYSEGLELAKVIVDNCEVRQSNIFYY
ncbi:MAG: hypothetical protein ACRC6X_04160 [Culicoidibacterales bacterium]